MKKSVLRNFAKFTGKHLCQSLFFNKIAGLRPATLREKETYVSDNCLSQNGFLFTKLGILSS